MSDDSFLLTPPDAAEVRSLGRGVLGALLGPGESLSPLQDLLVRTMFSSMTGHDVDPAALTPATASELAATLARRDAAFRARIVQVVLLVALVSRPLTPAAVERIRSYADLLEVDDDMIDVAARFAEGAWDLAQLDFDRNGYLASLDPERLSALHTSDLAQSWASVPDDPALASRWRTLVDLPVGTLGRAVADFYQDRGFAFPGLPGSAPPLLAQHDWVHVLADYGTALENEIEVFAFMARANDDPRGFSLLAMVVSLFETGYLASGAGLFEASPGHLSSTGMALRLSDALRRGALTTGSHDFLAVDWFALADRPVDVVRREVGVVGKADRARAAGSAGPWQPGGITEFQLRASREAAERDGIDRPAWAPDPLR